jgi:hypothetical protein
MPSGRPVNAAAAGVPSSLRTAESPVPAALFADSGSAAACRPRPDAACGAEPVDPEAVGPAKLAVPPELLGAFAERPAAGCPPLAADVGEDDGCAEVSGVPATLRRIGSVPKLAAACPARPGDSAWLGKFERLADEPGLAEWLDEPDEPRRFDAFDCTDELGRFDKLDEPDELGELGRAVWLGELGRFGVGWFEEPAGFD